MNGDRGEHVLDRSAGLDARRWSASSNESAEALERTQSGAPSASACATLRIGDPPGQRERDRLTRRLHAHGLEIVTAGRDDDAEPRLDLARDAHPGRRRARAAGGRGCRCGSKRVLVHSSSEAVPSTAPTLFSRLRASRWTRSFGSPTRTPRRSCRAASQQAPSRASRAGSERAQRVARSAPPHRRHEQRARRPRRGSAAFSVCNSRSNAASVTPSRARAGGQRRYAYNCSSSEPRRASGC